MVTHTIIDDTLLCGGFQLEIWGNVQVWRQAATQVFFALGLGYGSVIAYSSYNPVNNNCHRDALMVSCINFMTSVLASLVVFVVLGFRAKNIALRCVAEYGCVHVCLNISTGIGRLITI